HFSIYANPGSSSGPLQCDVPAGGALALALPVAGSQGAYDFTAYGPDGFQRLFAGSLALDCNQVDAYSSIDTNAGVMSAVLENYGTTAATFVVTDNYGLVPPATNNV